METPNEYDSVLAKVQHTDSLGLGAWYEVVYFDHQKWHSYAGSDTFNDGETVVEWKYCKDIFESPKN